MALRDPLIQHAMAQVALFDLVSRQWRAEPAACGAALPAQRGGPPASLRTAADEELVTHRRHYAALAEQRANHDMVLATVMALLDPDDINVDSKGVELALLATPIHPTRLTISSVDRLTRFAPSTRELSLDGIDCADSALAQAVALLPRLTELVLQTCSNTAAFPASVVRHLTGFFFLAISYLSARETRAVCNAMNHDGRLRDLRLACSFDRDDSDCSAAIDAMSELVRCSPRLRSFSVKFGPHDRSSGFAKVAHAVGQHSGLLSVELWNTDLDRAELFAMLHRHKLLRELDVDARGVDARLITALPNLRIVEISHSDLNKDVTVEVCHALKGLRWLTELHIGDNRELTLGEGRAICDAIAGKPLRKLGLHGLSNAEVCRAIAYAPDGAPTFWPMRNTLRDLQLEPHDPITTPWFQAMLPQTNVHSEDDAEDD
jgi:hypothetical protein